MNFIASECSSGCESGWTMYLEQSFLSPNDSHPNKGNGFVNGKSVLRNSYEEEEEEEEEDLSMVSDASSGPPHFQEEAEQANFNVDDDSCFCPKASRDVRLISKSVGKRKKSREQRHRGGQEQVPANFLDDTASSPVYNFSMNDYDMNNNDNNNQASMESVLEFSQDLSATHHFKGRSAFQDPYSLFQSSLSGNQLQKNRWFGGKQG